MKDIVAIVRKFPKANIRSLVKQSLKSLKPQPILTVSEVVSSSMMVKTSNGGKAPYDMKLTYYMEEPLNLISSRKYTKIIFMGPARTGKSEALLKGFATYCIRYSFKNLLVVHMTEKKAAEWSKTELRPMIERSPLLKRYKTNNVDDFSIYDLTFKTFNYIANRWPTIANLSAVTVQNVILTDYDRFPLDIDGEGNAAALAYKRITTFGNAGMCVIESSPGYLVEDINQKLEPHDCYNTLGIASEYNQGDKRCFYYQCLKCKSWFIAEWKTIWWDKSLKTIEDRAKTARVCCPHCKFKHDDRTNKKILIPNGRWLAQGEWLDREGVKHGKKLIDNGIASFKLTAPACAFVSLSNIVRDYEMAEEHYKKTGDERLLQTFFNVTIGVPYIPKALLIGTENDHNLAQNIDSTKPAGECPQDTLFIFASVDIQNGDKAGRFEVGIFAYTLNEQVYLINRFAIETYKGQGLRPHREVTDFDVLTHFMLTERIKVQGLKNKYLKIQGFAMDMGGNGNTTANAKEFYQRFKQMYGNAVGLHSSYVENKIFLFKGSNTSQHNNIQLINRDKREKSNAIPAVAYSIKVNNYKDIIYNVVKKPLSEDNSIHFYSGFSKKYIDEFNSEEKIKGKYDKKKGFNRNETLDLFVYAYALFDLIGARNIVKNIKKGNLTSIPQWALPLDCGNTNLETIDNYVKDVSFYIDLEKKDKDSELTNNENEIDKLEDVRKVDMNQLNMEPIDENPVEEYTVSTFDFF